jgi:hypothetical protein
MGAVPTAQMHSEERKKHGPHKAKQSVLEQTDGSRSDTEHEGDIVNGVFNLDLVPLLPDW